MVGKSDQILGSQLEGVDEPILRNNQLDAIRLILQLV